MHSQLSLNNKFPMGERESGFGQDQKRRKGKILRLNSMLESHEKFISGAAC